MEKIARLTVLYRVARRYVMAALRVFYRPLIVVGKENIPQDGHTIFTANHLNAFMDALTFLFITPKQRSTTFLARSDLFKNPWMARVLRFAKIMPAYRMRDGISNLANNATSFGHAEKILTEGNYIGIMPEGGQGEQRRMRPLVKGVFRIAFAAQEQCKPGESIKILPVGLDMGDLVKFGQPLIINIGAPIEVKEYVSLYQENPAVAINKLKDELARRLHNQTLDIASDLYYEEMETFVYAFDKTECVAQGMRGSAVNCFHARQQLAERLVEMERTQPERMMKLAEKAREFKRCLKQMNLRSWVMASRPCTWQQKLLLIVALLVTLPVFLVGLCMNILPFTLPIAIRKATKCSYEGFYSSIQFGGALLTFPLCYALQMLLCAQLLPLTWWAVVILLVLHPVFGKIAFEWWRLMRKTVALCRYTRLVNEKDEQMLTARRLYREMWICLRQFIEIPFKK